MPGLGDRRLQRYLAVDERQQSLCWKCHSGSSAAMTRHSVLSRICHFCQYLLESPESDKRAPKNFRLQVQSSNPSAVSDCQVPCQTWHGSCISSQQGQHAGACLHCSGGAGSSQPEYGTEDAICACACTCAIRCPSRSPAPAGANHHSPCNRAGRQCNLICRAWASCSDW